VSPDPICYATCGRLKTADLDTESRLLDVAGVVPVDVSAEHLTTSVAVDRGSDVNTAPSELLLDHRDSLALSDRDGEREYVDARSVRLTVGDEGCSAVADEAPRAAACRGHAERALKLDLSVDLELEDRSREGPDAELSSGAHVTCGAGVAVVSLIEHKLVADCEGEEGLVAEELTRTLEVGAEEVTSAGVAEEVLLSDGEVRGVCR
jgi:hypothetical protein